MGRPDAIVGLFKADVLSDHCIREIEQSVVKAKGAAGTC